MLPNSHLEEPNGLTVLITVISDGRTPISKTEWPELTAKIANFIMAFTTGINLTLGFLCLTFLSIFLQTPPCFRAVFNVQKNCKVSTDSRQVLVPSRSPAGKVRHVCSMYGTFVTFNEPGFMRYYTDQLILYFHFLSFSFLFFSVPGSYPVHHISLCCIVSVALLGSDRFSLPLFFFFLSLHSLDELGSVTW